MTPEQLESLAVLVLVPVAVLWWARIWMLD
jgi:hypothetical protein